MAGIVWLALDGVGHPADALPVGSSASGVWEQDLPVLRPLVEAGLRLDATLGIEGLPQSGTGQACWLTGQDAVRLMNGHFGPQPGPTLQKLLREQGLPARLQTAGARAALVNHYSPDYLLPPATGRNRLGCFPYSFRVAGLPLNPLDVPLLEATLGLAYQYPWEPRQDLQDLDVVRNWGKKLAQAAEQYDLLVADLWFSDLLGHQGQWPTPEPVLRAGRAYLRRVEALLEGLLTAGARVALGSDHGNLEDLTVKGHTLAGVPFAASGLPLGHPSDIRQGGEVVASWFGLD